MVNFPEQEYKDVFGGTIGNAAAAERDEHNIGLTSNTSTAMMDAAAQRRKDMLISAAKQVDDLNKED